MECLVEFKPKHGVRVKMESMNIQVPSKPEAKPEEALPLAEEWAKRQLATWGIDAEDVRVVVTPILAAPKEEKKAEPAAPKAEKKPKEKKAKKAPKEPKPTA